MNVRMMQICIWSGLVGMMTFGIALWPLAHWIPLLDPMYTAEEIAANYQSNIIGIRLAAIVMMFSAALNAAFFGSMYVFIKRIEGEGPLAIIQVMSSAVFISFFYLPAILFGITAFRPERAVELTLIFNDFAWIIFVISTPPGIMQGLATGLAILTDKRPQPLLPRWAGYFSLWMAVLYVPAPLALMFKTGPFAWNGILAFWVPAGIAFIWGIAMIVAMLPAIKRLADEAG